MPDPKLERAFALHRAGRIAEAVPVYRAVLEKQPRNFEALYRLGIALAQTGRLGEAAEWIEKAVRVRPRFARGHFDLGSLLGRLGRYAAAAAHLEKAVALRPEHAEAHHNLGNALAELGRPDDALDAFDRALALRPDFASAHFNRGNVLKGVQRYDRAIAAYRAALDLEPDHLRALNNLGNCLYELRRPREAAEAFERAIALKPDYTHAWFNLADLQRRQGLWEAAAESLERVIALEPDYPFAPGALASVRMHCCDWDAVEALAPRIVEGVRAGRPATPPFPFLALSDSAADQRTCAETWVRHDCPPAAPAVWRGEKYRHDRIRLAYVSADFHDHPMAFLMSGLFERHDRSRFELTAVAFDAAAATPVRRRLKDAFDRFIEARDLGDAEVARKIRELEIDIAVDRKGFTFDARTRVFALRPAPLQVNYLAYPGTMGAPYIDYIFADRFVIPPGAEKHYSEKVVRLPDTYQANDARRPVAAAAPSRAEAGLPERGFVFCCFNNSYKIARPVFDLWMGLLGEVEGSVLWLYEANAPAVRNLRAAAADRGVAPGRLVFGARRDNPDHLARLPLADLSLDTLPYGAHTTASDSLFAGVPIITCPGPTFAGAVTASLLHAIGLPELVVPTFDDYRGLALRLARDPDALARLRAKLAANRDTAPLFDTARFCRGIEAAYERIWARHQAGAPPEAFDVAPED